MVSCAAPDGIVMSGSPVAAAAASSAATRRGSSGVTGSVWRWAYVAVMPRRRPRGLLGERGDVRATPLEGVLVGAADVEREAHAGGDRVDQTGLDLDLADRADRATAGCPREPLELEHRLGEDGGRVEAEVHRRGAGVVAAALHETSACT